MTSPHLAFEPHASPGLRPAICVQGVCITPEAEHEAAVRISAAFALVRQLPDWKYVITSAETTDLAIGCPPPKNFDADGKPTEITDSTTGADPGFVLRLYVYPDGTLPTGDASVGAEVVNWSGDSGSISVWGLYFTPSQICSPGYLLEILEQNFGLLRGDSSIETPTPTPDAVCF
jgi:hypothetical protein